MIKRATLTILLLIMSCACATKDAVRFPAERWIAADDCRPQDMPKVDQKKIELDAVELEMYSEVEWLMSGGSGSGLGFLSTGAKVEALDVDNFDEVIDSTWFTNRIGRGKMPTAQIAAVSPPSKRIATTGPLEVITARVEGEAPRLLVKDSRGMRFMIKLEIPHMKGIPTGAEVITALILNAAGYNVPVDYISTIDLGRLTISDGATHRDEYGRPHPLDKQDLARIVAKAARDGNGRSRAVVSAVPDATLLGPFSFEGRWHNDKNDRLPHEHRRELRAYKLFAALVNDTKPAWGSTMDVFIPTDGEKGHVVHYMFDFSGAFGDAGNWKEIPPPTPPEEKVSHALLDVVTLGLRHSDEAAITGKYTFLGPVGFDPASWKPTIGSTAFSFMVRSDAFWAAKIMMLFSDDIIDAIVARAEFPDAEIRKYVAAALKYRRDMIVKYGFEQVSPLSEFEIDRAGDSAVVEFSDLAVQYGIEKREGTEYRSMLLGQMGRAQITPWQVNSEPKVELTPETIAAVRPGNVYILRIQPRHSGERWWGESVDLYVEKTGEALKLLGLKHRYYH